MSQIKNELGIWGWLGVIILSCFLLFKWLPDLLWRAAIPEIGVNEHIFETKPTWTMDGLVVTSTSLPKVYIRVSPKTATESRANLAVTVNGEKVENNCSGDENFCHKMAKVENGGEYEIVAKNSAGESRTKVKVIVKPKTDTPSNLESGSSSDTKNTNDSGSQNSNSQSTNNTQSPSVPHSPSTSSCTHYESGRCWDDLELDAYTKGLYDQQFGDYGKSVYYDDDCDQTCQDILDDAYDEGWYDNY